MTEENILQDQFRFLRGLIARPKNIGAIAPSGPALARSMAREIDAAATGPVLELGPGTGVVTAAMIERGIAPERITAIEYDPNFARLVAKRFPRVNVIVGDAFDLEHTLGSRVAQPFAAVVSGLPLLNFPVARRTALLEQIFARTAPGAPLIQFSYGMYAPAAPPPGIGVRRAAMIWRNLPPARVWVYRRV